MSKRIKSFFITLGSLALTALISVVLTPQWATFIQDVNSFLVSHGAPVSLVVVIGLLIAEMWKAFLNKRMASQNGYALVSTAKRSLDLY